jgi:hypothetical protein
MDSSGCYQEGTKQHEKTPGFYSRNPERKRKRIQVSEENMLQRGKRGTKSQKKTVITRNFATFVHVDFATMPFQREALFYLDEVQKGIFNDHS